MNKEFQKNIKMIDGDKTAIKLLKKHPNKYILIDNRMGIGYKLLQNNLKYYLPPRYKGSNLFLDIIAFAFQKDSYLVEPFNRM